MQKARIVIISKDNPRKRCSVDERGNEPMTNAFNHDARCLVKPAITVVLYVLSTSSVFRKAKMRRDGKLSGDYGCNGKNIMGNTHIMILYFETHSSLSITHLSASTLPLLISAHIRCQRTLHYPLHPHPRFKENLVFFAHLSNSRNSLNQERMIRCQLPPQVHASQFTVHS